MASAMDEISGTDPQGIASLVSGTQPGVIRGIAAHWPIVAAARQGDQAALEYLRGMGSTAPVDYSYGDPQWAGRFHYTDDFRGFNFRRATLSFDAFLGALENEFTNSRPNALAAQGLLAAQACPRFEAENPLPLRPGTGEARLWIGNRARVAAHTDPADNIAYCAAGQRRFTLYAPEQAGNLYLGPFDPTPAGTPIAMTDPVEPDFARYPRFAAACDAAVVTELDPGDAIFIPYGWFHHVQALSPFSMLVNYWWRDAAHGGSAWDALLHAMMSVRSLSPGARRHWRAMFDVYVFEGDGPAGEHLPPHARGVLDARDPQDLAAMRSALLRNLSRG